MNPVLQDILETGTVIAEDGTRLPIHSEIPQVDGEFLQGLIRKERPRRSLEVGLAYGVSSLYICDALAEVGAERHWVIDPLQNGQDQGAMRYGEEWWRDFGWSPDVGWRGIGLANLRRAGHAGLVEHLNDPSHLAIPSLIQRGAEIDFAFIDGWHTFDYLLVDFFLVDQLLSEGGVVAFDDSTNPAIRKALRYILTNRHYEVIDEQRVKAPAPSLKLRAANVLAERSGRVRRWLSVELSVRNVDLGLPRGRCVALRKTRHDVLGDGSGGSRRWNDHHPF